MANILSAADDQHYQALEHVIANYHERLKHAGATIEILIARPILDENNQPKGPPLKLRGHQCAALVAITNYRDRVRGMKDALIQIDGDWWDEADEDEQYALLDHELEHLQLKNGENLLDDCGRPKMRMKRHDQEYGWFDAVAARWGQKSIEGKQATKISMWAQQLELPFSKVA